MQKNKKFIIKEDGKLEKYNEEKIRQSLIKAGADPETANYTVKSINRKFKNKMKSDKIYLEAVRHLGEKNPAAAIRYTLKKAIMDLGPTGFIFEKYIAKILSNYGYVTQTGRFVRGYCVEHEVDVIAEKDKYHYMIECKYHNDKDLSSDIKTVLYVHSRFEDIKKASEKNLNDFNLQQGWLVTNTKVTNEAAKYASCVNLKIIAWHYPEDKNLEYYIENKKLYPISILNGLKPMHKEILFKNNTITIQDFLEFTPASLATTIHSNTALANYLFEQVHMLLN